jgi:hypothetical protein
LNLPQREATLAALTAAPEADLGKPTPESMREYAPTVGVAFNVVGIHTMMHAAQFVAVRRKLGKPVLIWQSLTRTSGKPHRKTWGRDMYAAASGDAAR